MVIRFGNYELGDANNILLTGWREMHGAERDIVMLGTAGVRGVKVLNDTFEAKVNELVGAIECDDDLDSQVREFVTAMSKKGQPLTIEDDDGTTYVYDGVYVTNTSDMIEMRTLRRKKIVKFRLLFLCPKGFARDTTQVTYSFDNITAFPYSDSLTINGDTNPEPVITVTLVDASTITDIFFTNQTTNQQISVSGITFVDGDMLTFDTANRQVRHNSTPIVFDGVFPDFTIGSNNIQLTASGSGNILIDQSQYNSEEILYGSRKLGLKFTAPSTASLSQLGLLLKRVDANLSELATYDDFSSGSINSAKWATAGSVSVASGQMKLSGTSASASTDGKTTPDPPGDPITQEAEWYQHQSSGTFGGGGTMRTRLSNGTDYIEIAQLMDVHEMIIRLGGHYGSGDGARWSSSSGTINVKQVGSNIEIRSNGVLRQTLSGKSFQANTHFEATLSTGDSSADFRIDNVKFWKSVTASLNEDITVRIETDSSGDPSGSLITNGSFTIPASEVGTSFSEIIKAYATEPSITNATVYHVVISQTGGDINNYYVLKKQNTDVLASANLETYNGSAWTQVTGEDLYLRLWSTLPTGVDIDMAIKYFPSYYTTGE